MSRSRRLRPVAMAVALAVLILAAGHPAAQAASDVWGNVGPASPLGSSGLFGRYPLTHYSLDQHFDAVSASLTGGVDVSGVPPMIAYFLASLLWLVTSFLANLLITLFAFAFSLDLVNGSSATGGAGALAPVSQAIHSIYADVFGAPWLVLAVAVAGSWAMWKALVQRRYAETAGALSLSLVYIVLALFFVAQPGATIGSASKLTNQMSEAFLSISDHGSPSGGGRAKDDAANQLFDLLVFKPWVVLEFGGLEHCAVTGTGSEDSDPESAPVLPLSSSPGRDASLARQLAKGTEVTADGKVCINNARKYAPHFLRFSLGADEMDERGDEYDALNDGDSSELPEADPETRGYRLGVADKPATDAMEEGGQFQRLGLALVVFFGELGAFLLLGALSVGVILAQVLLLLLLAFAPVALVAAAIPGRGHDFFRGWLQKLAGYLLRKAAYSLILATLLAVSGALATATSQLGWLMSFALQALFFWAVFLQRRTLTESLIGIATGPGAPGREGTLGVLALYYGARTVARPLRGIRRRSGQAMGAPGRLLGGLRGSDGAGASGRRAPLFGTRYSAPLGGGLPSMDAPGPTEAAQAAEPVDGEDRSADPASAAGRSDGPVGVRAKGAGRRSDRSRQGLGSKAQAESGKNGSTADRSGQRQSRRPSSQSAEPVSSRAQQGSEASLGEELRAERERLAGKPADAPSAAPSPARGEAGLPRRARRKGGGR